MQPSHFDRLKSFQPSPRSVDDLIQQAEQHPLGTDFLKNGAQDAVAATFSVHAFVVDKARERLNGHIPS